MAIWADWFPDVIPQVPACPVMIVEHELRRASQQFFEATRAWKVSLAAVPVVAGTQNITLATVDANQEIVRLEQAWYDGLPLEVETTETMDANYSDDWQLHTGKPSAAIQMGPGTVRLYPVPIDDAATGFKCRVSVRPSDVSVGIPDEYRVKYREHIATGAKARLMIHANKPWANADLAMMYGTAFGAAIGKENSDAARAFGQARIAARVRWC